jgi:hypothetical protein
MKSITIDSVVEGRLSAHLGGDVPALDSIVVFEATTLTTRPLSKDGTIWENATVTRTTLGEMAASLNGGALVPLHTLHLQGHELPVGRFFYAETFDTTDGHTELRALFYLPKTEEKLIADIEAGVIQALSVGISTTSLLCSECGFDYLAAGSDFIHIIERTCDKGHEIGVDGVHAIGAGLKRWRETSLVSIGASADAAIHARSKSRLSPAQQYRLAASEGSKDITLVATIQRLKDTEMTAAEFTAALTASAEAKVRAEVALTAAQAETVTAAETVVGLQAQVTDLTAQLAAASDADVSASLIAERDTAVASVASANAEAATTLAFLQSQATKALIASGSANPVAPETIADCITSIETSSINLVNLMANAGKSLAADAIANDAKSMPALGAFRVKR